jgi:L-fucose isomerase-like protein
LRPSPDDEATDRFGFIPVSPVGALNEDAPRQILADYGPALAAFGGRRWFEDQLLDPAPLFYFLLSGGTEEEVLRLQDRRHQSRPGEPALLLAHPGNNSLPAALEVLARLQQDRKPGRVFLIQGPEDEEGYRRLQQAAHDLEVRRALQDARIGCLGEPSDWLVASTPSPAVVRDVWGPEVVAVDPGGLTQAVERVSAAAVGGLAESLAERAVSRTMPSTADVDVEKAIRVYLAVKGIVRAHRLDALTVRCFDVVRDLQTTACFALAQLNDEGIVAGCEGDLVSTLGMLWARKLLGATAWMANPAEVDEERNTLWLAHCSVPLTIVEDYRVRSHFESGLGVGIQGTLPSGPITLLRIGGRMLSRIWLAEGRILKAGQAENRCRTQAQIQLSGQSEVGELLRAPLGNHLAMVFGHHAARIAAWHRTMMIGVA